MDREAEVSCGEVLEDIDKEAEVSCGEVVGVMGKPGDVDGKEIMKSCWYLTNVLNEIGAMPRTAKIRTRCILTACKNAR